MLLAHAAPLTALGINAAGTQMLSASEDSTVKLWALPLVAPKLFTHPDPITSLVLTPDGGRILTGGNDKIVRLWNLTSGAKERDYAGPTLPIVSAAISSSRGLFASARDMLAQRSGRFGGVNLLRSSARSATCAETSPARIPSS